MGRYSVWGFRRSRTRFQAGLKLLRLHRGIAFILPRNPQLRPVAFHYKEYPNDSLEYGLLAEEVAEIYPDLVTRDKNGQIEGVQYHKVNALLLNEVQRLQRELQRREDEIRALTTRLSTIETLVQARLQSSGGL